MSRHIEPLPELADAEVMYAAADVADHQAVEQAIREAEARFGPTECLINDAGMADGRDFKLVDHASFAREIDTNLKGALNCISVVPADMSRRHSGTIINISSGGDRKTSAVAVTYTATKYAVRALASACARRKGRAAPA